MKQNEWILLGANSAGELNIFDYTVAGFNISCNVWLHSFLGSNFSLVHKKSPHLPSGKRLYNYGKSPFYYVNQL